MDGAGHSPLARGGRGLCCWSWEAKKKHPPTDTSLINKEFKGNNVYLSIYPSIHQSQTSARSTHHHTISCWPSLSIIVHPIYLQLYLVPLPAVCHIICGIHTVVLVNEEVRARHILKSCAGLVYLHQRRGSHLHPWSFFWHSLIQTIVPPPFSPLNRSHPLLSPN